MKKRLFAIMLALAMLLVAVPALAEEGEVEKQNQEKIEKQETGKVTENNTLIEKNEQQQSNEAQLKSQPVKAPASPVGTGNCSAGNHDWSKKDGVCTICGFKCTHNWEKDDTNVIEPTCTQSGTIKLDCTICGKATRQTNAKPLGHEYDAGTVTKEPTETETGIKTFACKRPGCGEIYTETIPKTGGSGHTHVWGEPVETKATCKEPGKRVAKCTVTDCNEEQITIIPIDPNAHNYSIKGEFKTPVTCLKDGLQILECEHCGHKTVATVKAPGSHTWGEPTWSWCGFTSASATFTCTRNCGYSVTQAASVVRSSINNCGYYTYTATVQFNGQTYTNTRTDYSCRPDWYYDPCYYNNPCGHWGCGNVCTRYSNCVPCRDYRTTFRVGGYNCLATPKTGDASVIAPAMLALIGAAGAMLGKKRR